MGLRVGRAPAPCRLSQKPIKQTSPVFQRITGDELQCVFIDEKYSLHFSAAVSAGFFLFPLRTAQQKFPNSGLFRIALCLLGVEEGHLFLFTAPAAIRLARHNELLLSVSDRHIIPSIIRKSNRAIATPIKSKQKPRNHRDFGAKAGAGCETRTRDLMITNQVLYRLS